MLNKNIKDLLAYANKILPGVSGLLGKRPNMYLPNQWPTYYSKAKGINIWDYRNIRYLDFTMHGVGCCALGYADEDINRTAKKILDRGSLTTLNSPEEIELAELLISIHPWAEQVKYARTGGETMTIAVRLARAATRRDKLLICGYHGWHDWYLAANLGSDKRLDGHLLPGLKPLGVPRSLKDSVIPFKFNSFEDLKNVVEKKAGECAAIIIEPARSELMSLKFAKELRRVADKNKCVLIFDEITCGWRNDTSGIHKELGVNPDLVVFGKTIANGIPMTAILGKKSIMQETLNTFVSSVNWTDRLGPACALTFIKKHKKLNLGKILISNGKKIRNIWKKCARRYNLNIEISGIYPLSTFKIINNNWPLVLSYFIQEMLKKKILASDRCYSNFCQNEKNIKIYEDSCDEIFHKLSVNLLKGDLNKKLNGPIKDMGFHRLV